MPFVRRHVYRRLKAAKAECDKELQRVTNSITAFFEEMLRDNEHEQEAEREQREHDRDRERDLDAHQQGEQDQLREGFVLQPSELRSALQLDDGLSSDGGYEAEAEGYTRSRHQSFSSSPASLRRHSTLPRDKSHPNLPATGTTSPASSSATPPPELAASPRKRENTGNSSASGQWGGQSLASRRLSRTIHIPVRAPRSGASSRSTSRSRSPLPRSSYAESTATSSNNLNRRSSRILVDDPVDPIMTTLYEIIGVATDVIDMSINQLTANPKICESLVQRVQNIGKAWDEHPDWHGRNWYVQVLLAIASLSRVVEWWEAEKQFWNFDDNDDEQEEPLLFVMKPADEEMGPPLSARHDTSFTTEPEEGRGPLKVPPEDENRLRMSRTTSQNRRSRDEAPKDLSANAPQKEPEHARNTESARVLATERLRLQAETAQNQHIVMELSLDGDHFIWINYAWRNVVGSDPEELVGTRISKLLAASDWHVFRDATRRLMQDDSHTVEVRFKLKLYDPESDRDPGAPALYRQMEGKGMLMIDREDGQPSHTMWVVRPIGPPECLQTPPSILLETGDIGDEPGSAEASTVGFGPVSAIEPVTPFPGIQRPISTALILCRICECNIPQWYFEKHNETCSEVHRLEAEIGECNESISELRNTIRELQVAMDRSSPATVPEYRGMPIFSPSSSPSSSSPLSLLRAPLKMKRMSIKKAQRQILEQLEDILSLAAEVSIPALKEEEAQEPIERQRLLSPGSERKMSQIRRWNKPSIEDQALTQLIDDAERVMRQKIDSVVRMQNTIRYSEKIRQEWEEQVEQQLAEMEDGESDSEGEDEQQDVSQEQQGQQQERGADDDASSTTSEYAFGGHATSPDPTPLASASPIPFAAPQPVQRQESNASSFFSSAPMPMYWQPSTSYHTRSSTPSSISSPLALAAPIVASSSLDDTPPPMDLNEAPPTVTKARKSPQNLEPKLLITPPLSPTVSPQDVPTARRISRRQSSAQPIISPTTSVSNVPLSPRLPSVAPLSRSSPASIKDFEIIKPISKGAFGSVFLAKKKSTGDYFAIKVLKKADMIAKNQITNVKAERMILMKQAESPFVAKLYFTFQSKENLYLVMEYLNGGDCAALIKSLGSLPEEWTRNYIAEVVLGLESLHQRGIVHRYGRFLSISPSKSNSIDLFLSLSLSFFSSYSDLKPDNLLIDQHGHLKLTDFGLSRIGLLGRQTRDGQLSFGGARARTRHNSRPPSIDSYLSSPLLAAEMHAGGSYFTQRAQSNPRPGSSPYLPLTDDYSESSGSESVYNFFPRRSGKQQSQNNDSPLQSFATELTTDLRSHPTPGGTPPGEQKVVGTPDYLAPETILGLRGDDAAVDWWALGVITYEFLYGIPPFHDETPEKVFENILSGHIDWHEDYVEVSPEAKDFMQRLMTLDPAKRLGANGADEVKAHPFFAGIDWDNVTTTEAAFIPQVTDPESTDYFDPRGAVLQLFHDDDAPVPTSGSLSDSPNPNQEHNVAASAAAAAPIATQASSPADDDFGSFSFKNLPVLKQANDDVIRKLRTDQMAPITHTLSEPSNLHSRRKSISNRVKKPSSVITTGDVTNKPSTTSPPSPATSTSSIASSPSRGPTTPGSATGHVRKPSEFNTVERFKLNYMDSDVHRRNSMPSRLRTASVSTSGDGSGSESWTNPSHINRSETATPPSSVASIDLKRAPDPQDRAVTCLLAEDNPITAKIIETLLIRLGCRCVVVADGSEAISVAMGDIKFDCILMDLHMPILDGEGAARYIKTTNNKNQSTPIIAVSAYGTDNTEAKSDLFAASLAKPVQKADLLAAMRQLGFKTSTVQGRGPGAKITAQVPTTVVTASSPTLREYASSNGPHEREESDLQPNVFTGRAKEFVELHDQVQTSVNLLDSLESFLSTFQKDLSAVSGQISDLQDRSKDIEGRLKSRRKIEKPLSNLLLDLCIPPPLATVILDTNVGEPWIQAITEFEQKLVTLKLRARVKAARDLHDVAEGLRIVAATKIRAFFLNLLQPIRTSMTTNMQVIQTSVFLKYRPLYAFLQRHAPNVASEVQRAYVGAARTYYETGFRRYIRSLGWVKARSVEKADTIVTGAGETTEDANPKIERLSFAHIDGPGVTMAYMAEDKSHKEPLEAVFRSLMLVLMDNATAEYTFVTSFFASEPQPNYQHQKETSASSSLLSPPSLMSPTQADFDDTRSNGSDYTPRSPGRRLSSLQSAMNALAMQSPEISEKEEQANMNNIWKQIMDPVLDYCKAFIASVLEPAPPVVPLLTMIRLVEDVMAEVQKRGCVPLENFIFSIRLQMWPVFQKGMADNIDALKKYAEGASAGYFRRGAVTTDASVATICQRYVVLFGSFVALTASAEETMIFSNLLRLRQELSKLIASHTEKIGDPVAKATAQSTFYEGLLQGLSRGPGPASHPKAQSEIAYWREREEEARRRIASTRRQR
ncbi:hypothetical protein K474DRAFT_1712758 [Panus rudis PR-1116 ss-1]|nr:hypothetical protein K474DRAFT_1712758 [Panus rudis PR-1116 ss-1]